MPSIGQAPPGGSSASSGSVTGGHHAPAVPGARGVRDGRLVSLLFGTQAAGVAEGIALARLRRALLHGISYLDGGWAQLVSGPVAAASNAGVRILSQEPARAVTGGPGSWEVVTRSDRTLRAGAVVLAAGGPAGVRDLFGWTPSGARSAPP